MQGNVPNIAAANSEKNNRNTTALAVEVAARHFLRHLNDNWLPEQALVVVELLNDLC